MGDPRIVALDPVGRGHAGSWRWDSQDRRTRLLERRCPLAYACRLVGICAENHRSWRPKHHRVWSGSFSRSTSAHGHGAVQFEGSYRLRRHRCKPDCHEPRLQEFRSACGGVLVLPLPLPQIREGHRHTIGERNDLQGTVEETSSTPALPPRPPFRTTPHRRQDLVAVRETGRGRRRAEAGGGQSGALPGFRPQGGGRGQADRALEEGESARGDRR